MTNEQLENLLQRFANGETNPGEEALIAECFGLPEYEPVLKDFIMQHWDDPRVAAMLSSDQSDQLYASIQTEIAALEDPPVPAVRWKTWLAAASVAALLMTGVLYYWTSYRRGSNEKQLIGANRSGTPTAEDIAPPAASNAVLFLDNGASLNLNNTDSTTLTNHTGNSVHKLPDGRLVYEGAGQAAVKTRYFNTIYNPRGSQQARVELSDGSKVWLNAESSLKYPVRFTGSERRVEVNGEAYFEVAHNPARPFIVANGKTRIQVLGTHFNVNTYRDNGKVIVTLLEGAVHISNGADSALLKPGQQARIDNEVKVFNQCDTSKAMAWKNEVFNFNQTGIREIMKQVERWYDVQVEYQGDVGAVSLSGIIDRNINASQVLKMLEISSGLNFRINGRKIIVTK